MLTASLLFPLGARLSTWVTILVFVVIAAWRSDSAPLLAMISWLAGFEAAYQLAAMILHTPKTVPFIGPISISLLVAAPSLAIAASVLGARPNRWLLAAAISVFLAWLASGFHVNATTAITSVSGEVLNDASKTLWAFAYLVPLLRIKVSRKAVPMQNLNARL